MDEKAPRILVEDGPFYRRVQYALLFLFGCILGVVVALVIVFHSIQQSRFQSCEATNMRNEQTIVTLKRELAAAHISEAQREQSLQFTIALIDDLAPIKNCQQTIR